jgi:hypothetical protein
MSATPNISGLQEAQAACLALLAAMRPSGALGRAVQFGLATASRLAIAGTPTDTGSWRASHRVKLEGLRGEVFIDPSARNSKNSALVSVYSAALARKKGGRYDVYKSVYQQQGVIAQAAARYVLEELPR